MNDPVQLQQMKNRCMEKIHSFDPEYIGGKWINLINDTLNCKGNKIGKKCYLFLEHVLKLLKWLL